MYKVLLYYLSIKNILREIVESNPFSFFCFQSLRFLSCPPTLMVICLLFHPSFLHLLFPQMSTSVTSCLNELAAETIVIFLPCNSKFHYTYVHVSLLHFFLPYAVTFTSRRFFFSLFFNIFFLGRRCAPAVCA
jgi:hypothetical protein